MKEFYLINDNSGAEGPYELEAAFEKCNVFFTESFKKECIRKYHNGESFEFNVVYGFKHALITVWPHGKCYRIYTFER